MLGLISLAWAMAPPQGGAPGAQGGGLAGLVLTFLPLIIIFAIFYFLLIRPQQKKMKEHQKFLSELRPGQRVFTAGGIIGKIIKIENDVVWLEVEKDIAIPVIKGYISGPFNQ